MCISTTVEAKMFLATYFLSFLTSDKNRRFGECAYKCRLQLVMYLHTKSVQIEGCRSIELLGLQTSLYSNFVYFRPKTIDWYFGFLDFIAKLFIFEVDFYHSLLNVGFLQLKDGIFASYHSIAFAISRWFAHWFQSVTNH